MTRETMGRKSRASGHRAVAKHGAFEMVKSYLPAGSTQRTAAGIGAAAFAALLAAAVVGVGPAALAGAAGYVVYHEIHR